MTRSRGERANIMNLHAKPVLLLHEFRVQALFDKKSYGERTKKRKLRFSIISTITSPKFIKPSIPLDYINQNNRTKPAA